VVKTILYKRTIALDTSIDFRIDTAVRHVPSKWWRLVADRATLPPDERVQDAMPHSELRPRPVLPPPTTDFTPDAVVVDEPPARLLERRLVCGSALYRLRSAAPPPASSDDVVPGWPVVVHVVGCSFSTPSPSR